MTLKSSRQRLVSNYDEATAHLLNAFFCVTGQSPKDERLRKTIEAVLINLNKLEYDVAPSNVIKFRRRGKRTVK
jgi:hypothetical protein